MAPQRPPDVGALSLLTRLSIRLAALVTLPKNCYLPNALPGLFLLSDLPLDIMMTTAPLSLFVRLRQLRTWLSWLLQQETQLVNILVT